MKMNIELDIFGGIDHTGVYSGVFVGEDADTPIETTTTWEEIISSEVERVCIPNGGPIVVSNDSNGVEEIQSMAEMLRGLADQLETEAAKHLVFLRDDWLNGTDDITGANKPIDDYCVSYENYIEGAE